MAKVDVYNQEGKSVESLELSDAVFAVTPKVEVVHDAVVAAFANTRQVLAHTKGRRDIRGGGKKPWRQKGTGRARHGSIRSPLWRGGGVTFGPTKNRNFKKRINKKAKQNVMRMILSDRLAHGGLVVVDSLAFAEPKTKDFAKMKGALPCGYKRALVVTPSKDENILRMTNNIKRVKTTFVGELGLKDLVEYPYLIVSRDAVKQLEKKYA